MACSKLGPGNFVQCDGCSAWWHFECAGVDATVSERDWMCSKCDTAASVAGRSHRSDRCRSSVSQDLEQLKRQQEIERQQADLEMQKKFLQQQQDLLDKARTAEETRSQKSKVSRRAHNDRVQQWVQNSSDGKEEGAVGGDASPAASPHDHDTQQAPPDTRSQKAAPEKA